MASQGPIYPASVSTASVTPEDDNDWLTPGNVSADDGSEAQITAATYDSPDISFRLRAVCNAGQFTIPTGSTIDGIIVEIERRCFAGSATDNRVQLLQGTSLIGDNKATGTAWPGTLGVATYGSSSDKWNATPSVTDINNGGFGVALAVNATAANTDIGVDYIRVTVHYTEANPEGTGAIVVPAATVDGTGTHTANPTGTGSITVPSATVAGTGAETFTATGSISVPAATTSGTGEEILTATGAVSVPAATVSGTGEEVFTATGAVTVPPPTVAGSGEHSEGAPPPPEGTGAITVPAATVAGTGSLVFTATGAITVPSATVAGSGAEQFTATGDIAVSPAVVAGTGVEIITGSGSIVVPTVTVAGTGVHALPITGTGSVVVPAAVISGSGNSAMGGQGSVGIRPGGHITSPAKPGGQVTLSKPSGKVNS